MASNCTFTVLAECVDPEPGKDGLVAVLNNALVSSGKCIAIESIRAYYASPFNSDLTAIYGSQGIIGIERITAHSGGVNSVAVKFDTNTSALSANIELKEMPESVTISGGTIRRFGDVVSSCTITSAIPFQAMMRAPGVCDSQEGGRNMEGHNVLHKMQDSSVEPIVLREGEGIALIKRAFGIPQAHHSSVVIRVVSTGKTYRYYMSDVGSPYDLDGAIWSLMNTTGSGIVIEVWVANMCDIGEHNIPRFRITRIGGIDSFFGGTSIAPSKHDASKDVSDVVAWKGPLVARPLCYNQGVQADYLNYAGTPITVAVQQKFDTFRHWLHGAIYTLTHVPQMRFENECEIWPGDRRGVFSINDELVLHPGEGIAVLGGGNGLIETSEGAWMTIEIIGRLYTNATASSGIAGPVIGRGVVVS
jgi:hypothetical protein